MAAPRTPVVALLLLSACLGLGARKPTVLRPARTADEAAEAFYPEIKKVLELHQRWAASAVGAELDSCRHHYRQAVLDAFGQYTTSRRREFMQTRWPRTYIVLCHGKQKKIRRCTQSFAAPLGQEFDTVGMRVNGRGMTGGPTPSADRRHLVVVVSKRGEGTSRTRIFISTQRTVEDIERELDREVVNIRKKLERHSLPSDVTLAKYQP